MHKVLIEDEGGWPLGEQVEADGRIHCKTGGLSVLEAAFPRYPLLTSQRLHPPTAQYAPAQAAAAGKLPLHPQGLFWEGAKGGSQLLPNPDPTPLHLPLHSHGSLSTRHGTELVRKPGRAAVTNTQVPRR